RWSRSGDNALLHIRPVRGVARSIRIARARAAARPYVSARRVAMGSAAARWYVDAVSSISLAEGSVFAGDYRVMRPLGDGGVCAVEQLSTGRRRALKVMRAETVRDAASRRRFEQEARVGAAIKSDHVVEVIAAGVDDASGMPWLAMELLEGEDLAHTLARRG